MAEETVAKTLSMKEIRDIAAAIGTEAELDSIQTKLGRPVTESEMYDIRSRKLAIIVRDLAASTDRLLEALGASHTEAHTRLHGEIIALGKGVAEAFKKIIKGKPAEGAAPAAPAAEAPAAETPAADPGGNPVTASSPEEAMANLRAKMEAQMAAAPVAPVGKNGDASKPQAMPATEPAPEQKPAA